MMKGDNSGQVLEAVNLLYSSSGEERRAANQWLMDFVRTQEAWGAAHSLMAEGREEVAYFGANMLYVKVRSEWHSLAEVVRRTEYERLWHAFTVLASSTHNTGSVASPAQASKRLCLAIAAAASRTPGLAVQTAQMALSMLAEDSLRARNALELLAALPLEVIEEETASGSFSHGRTELRELVRPVLDALQVHATISADSCLGCMRALHGWLSLQVAGVSLFHLYSEHGSLLGTTLHALIAPDSPALNSAAADALTELLSASNSPLSPTSPPEMLAAVEKLSAQLELMSSQLGLAGALAPRTEIDDRTLGFCRVLAAFAERAVDLVAVTTGTLLGMVELMLLCAGAELRVAELTVDFWCGLQDTPVAQRHEALVQPLYRRLAEIFMRQCTLPSDFVSWEEEVTVDEEEFTRFRERSALEVLESCLVILGAEFVVLLHNALGSAGSTWQDLEVTLFALRGMHVNVKAALRDGNGESPSDARAKTGNALQHLLSYVFAQFSAWSPAGHPAQLVESVCRLIGVYSKWVQQSGETLLRSCLRVSIESLNTRTVAAHAAEAFRALCAHGKTTLGRPAVLEELVAACAPLVASQTLEPDLTLTIQGGLACLVGASTSSADAAKPLHALVHSPCEIMDQLLSQGRLLQPSTSGADMAAPVDAQTGTAIAHQIHLISTAMRYCDTFSRESSDHPVLSALQFCWALLQEAAARGTSEMLLAVYELYGRAMACLRGLLSPLLPQLLNQLSATYCRTPIVGCLTCLTQALELYGAESPDEEAVLAQAVEQMINVTCAAMESAAAPEAEPELLTAFFDMCHRCLVFRPSIILSLPCLPRLFSTACSCVCHQEYTHTRAAITFLCLFLSGTDAANAHREGSAHCLQASGAELMRQSIRGLASASPANLIDHQIELLRNLVESAPSTAHEWLLAALNDTSIDLGTMLRHGATMDAFTRSVSQRPTSISGFQTIAADFSRMCRGKIRAT